MWTENGWHLFGCAVLRGRQGYGNGGVERRGAVEVEEIFEGVRVLIAFGQVEASDRSDIIGIIVVIGISWRAWDGEEALFDEGQQRRVVTGRV